MSLPTKAFLYTQDTFSKSRVQQGELAVPKLGPTQQRALVTAASSHLPAFNTAFPSALMQRSPGHTVWEGPLCSLCVAPNSDLLTSLTPQTVPNTGGKGRLLEYDRVQVVPVSHHGHPTQTLPPNANLLLALELLMPKNLQRKRQVSREQSQSRLRPPSPVVRECSFSSEFRLLISIT